MRTSLRLTSRRQRYQRHIIQDLIRLKLILEYYRKHDILSELLIPAFWVECPRKNALYTRSFTLYAKFCHSGEARKH
jgi:hypothetical protein